jgi:hypothetical protein
MSMSFGDDVVKDPSTMRGRDWPCLRQFCVFLENRVGRLNDLLRHIERDDLRVVALSIIDSVDCAITRLLLDDFERGRELFSLSEFTVIESDIIGVELPDDPQPYVQICAALLRAELNIHYTYPLLYRRGGRSGIAIYVDDIDAGLQILSQEGHRLITEGDLLEEGFY